MHKYVNLYISPRNAIGISGEVVKRKGVKVSIGNAASEYVVIRNFADVYIDRLIREVRKIRDWTLGEIPRFYYNPKSLYLADDDTKGIVREIIDNAGVRIDIIVKPDMFFLPQRKVKIYKNIFDSEMQTLTISVNTVGVMGKGLASRLKYLYPAAYVAYQDYVKSGLLKPGRPVVYRMKGEK